ncbi:MAG: GNAT family protein [Bacteroidia bacterium]
MLRNYKCLSTTIFSKDEYTLLPIRDEDKYAIMQWRNEQLDVLRQIEPLTKEKQEWYFENIVNKLFEEKKPSQLLFSFLENDVLIGYGGLVHIDWESRNAEISFLLSSEHNKNEIAFKKEWDVFLSLTTEIAFTELIFHKIYTYAYNIRDYYFEVMYKQDFVKEAQLREHILIKNKLEDVLILSKIKL